MRHLLLIALICNAIALITVPVPAGAESADSLWAEAVSLMDASAGWVPGNIYMHMQEVDKHGEPKEDRGHEVWTRLYLREDGEVDSEMVKVLDNGEDVTEKERARAEEEEEDDDGGGRMTMESYSPFDPEHQDGLAASPTGQEEIVDGRLCAVFEFVDERKSEDEDDDNDGTVIGKAWIEYETGIPLKIEYTTDPLPKRVKKMITTVHYEYQGPGEWYAKSMSIRATGGILFIKKHFHMNMAFSEFWRLPDEADSSAASADAGTSP